MSGSAHELLNGGRALLPTQDRLFRSDAGLNAILGGYRSGKTRGAALTFLRAACKNPWTPAYGSDRPFSIVSAPTFKVLKDSAHREFKAVCPPSIILRETSSPDLTIELVNGHVIKFRTFRGSMDGATCCVIWCDEAHQMRDEGQLLNYLNRASDPNATVKRVIMSGLPLSGLLEDQFGADALAGDPQRFAVFAAMSANTYLDPMQVAQMRKSTSHANARTYLDGQWQTPQESVFYEFSAGTHIIADPGQRDQDIHFGLDVGASSAVIMAQERMRDLGRGRPEKCLHVVDEVIGTGLSTEQLMRQALARGWRLNPSVSKIYCDPTIRADEIASVRRAAGDAIGIIKQTRGTQEEQVERGYEAVNAALRDADGKVRLTFSDRLPRIERSLLYSIPRVRRGSSGRVSAQDRYDHGTDALRYLVVGRLPLGS